MGNPLLKASEYQYNEGKILSTTTKIENEQPEKQNEEDNSSEDDAEKFRAAAHANAIRLSEKKVMSKLTSEALNPTRKNTIDIESWIKKVDKSEEKSNDNLIK